MGYGGRNVSWAQDSGQRAGDVCRQARDPAQQLVVQAGAMQSGPSVLESGEILQRFVREGAPAARAFKFGSSQ